MCEVKKKEQAIVPIYRGVSLATFPDFIVPLPLPEDHSSQIYIYERKLCDIAIWRKDFEGLLRQKLAEVDAEVQKLEAEERPPLWGELFKKGEINAAKAQAFDEIRKLLGLEEKQK